MCVLTIGGHEEASGDLLSLTEVGLNLVASGIKLPAMDAAGFDIQHIKALLLMTARHKVSVSACGFPLISVYLLICVITDCMS